MLDRERMRKEIAHRAGHSRTIRAWGKCEIFLGLTAAGAGLILGCHFAARPVHEIAWGMVAAALALIVLGGYLTLAGHRSHLYQSSFEQTAYLIEEIRNLTAEKETRA
jgi:hypothetical protein